MKTNNWFEKREYGIATAIIITFLICVIKITPVGATYAPSKFTPNKAYVKEVLVTPTPPIEHATSQQDAIINEIREVFGKDSDDAFRILSCENKGLRPDAVNTNTDGSKDYGIFQINNKWQGVTNVSFLTDWKINVNMAKRIFDGRGNWSAWACAKKVGL